MSEDEEFFMRAMREMFPEGWPPADSEKVGMLRLRVADRFALRNASLSMTKTKT